MIYLQFLATVFMFVMNSIAIMLPLNGMSTKDLSDIYMTLITPAGFTFSIWSLIYFAMISISVLVLLKKIILPKITLSRYVVSCLCNGLWIVAWHYQNLHLSMILMLVLLISLIMVDSTMKGQEKSISYYPAIRS
jgi:translocator protein